jgi:hypothetical protein
MNVMLRHVLRLAAIGAVIFATLQLASAFNCETGGAVKLAMGPTSAPQKSSSTWGTLPATPCGPSEQPCAKPRYRSTHPRDGAAAPTK